MILNDIHIEPTLNTNVFDKPNEQCGTCSFSAMARKMCMNMNHLKQKSR